MGRIKNTFLGENEERKAEILAMGIALIVPQCEKKSHEKSNKCYRKIYNYEIYLNNNFDNIPTKINKINT